MQNQEIAGLLEHIASAANEAIAQMPNFCVQSVTLSGTASELPCITLKADGGISEQCADIAGNREGKVAVTLSLKTDNFMRGDDENISPLVELSNELVRMRNIAVNNATTLNSFTLTALPRKAAFSARERIYAAKFDVIYTIQEV